MATSSSQSFKNAYLQYLRSRINPASFLGRIKKPVVVDYLHGSGSGLMGELIHGKKLVEIHTERDPLFGGVDPEPIEENLKDLKAAVLKNRALVGIAFDGDADRVGIIDDKGRYLTPCQVFPMLLELMEGGTPTEKKR